MRAKALLKKFLKRMKKIQKTERWIKHWAGHFNVLYDTLLGAHNTQILKNDIGECLTQALYIYRKGYTFAYFEEDDYRIFGKKIATAVTNDPKIALFWSKNLIRSTDTITAFMKKYMRSNLTSEQYQEFVHLFNEYSTWHRPVKVVVDFLPPDILKKVMPALSKSRIHAEHVYDYNEKIIRNYAKRMSKKSGYAYEHLLALNEGDMIRYFKNGTLPKESVLAERYKGCAMLFRKGSYTTVTGAEVSTIENTVAQAHEKKMSLREKRHTRGLCVER